MSDTSTLLLALLLAYLITVAIRCVMELVRLRCLMRRNDKLGKRIELSRSMDTEDARRELEAISIEQEEIERELDEMSVRRTLTLGVWR